MVAVFELTPALKQYLQEIGDAPLLDHRQEIELGKQIEAGNKSAIEEMVKANLRLVTSIAWRYAGKDLPIMDLIQEGNIGLLLAVEKYDWRRGTRFSTHAGWWIRTTIERSIDNHAKMIRLPVYVAAASRKHRRMNDRMTQELGRQPTCNELSERLKVDVDTVREIQALPYVSASLDSPSFGCDDGDSFARRFSAVLTEEESVDGVLGAINAEAIIGYLSEALEPHELDVLVLRYGIYDQVPLSHRAIGARLGLGRDKVRRIEATAKKKSLEVLQKQWLARAY